MPKAPKKAVKKSVPKKYHSPLSLHPLDFTQAVDKLLKAKPAKKKSTKRK
jgi:hypothetical protein